MKTYLLPENGQFYKANLHAHSTVSDGAYTPEALKDIYKAKGYSVLAYTDHELLVDHSDLTDENFLALTAFEYAFIEKEDYGVNRTVEFNLFAKDPHNTTQVCFDPKYVMHGEKWRASVAKTVGEPFERVFTPECMQKVIDAGRENGFLVSLNHPGYSMITPEFFGNFQGLFAMEIYNHISFISSGVDEYNPAMYEDMLRRGHRLSCIAADDCHSGYPDTDHRCDRYGGFTMIKADSLEYGNIISALEKGNFYASRGPLIEELYIEDGAIHLHCSPAKYVVMNTHYRGNRISIAPEGENLTHVVFPVPGRNQNYFRFTVIDENGKQACTRAYFFDEL